jgi:hypothetical protein
MLRATVGLSRKISRDYNSTGYSVNLEGEILASTDDPEAITEKIKELYSLAQEALAQEIYRDQGDDGSGRREEERPAPGPVANESTNGNAHNSSNGSDPRSRPTNGHGTRPGQNGNEEAATNKQVQFLLTMGKRFKLSTPQLENRIADICGRRCGVYELTKKEACLVLDHFTKDANGTSNGNGNQGR